MTVQEAIRKLWPRSRRLHPVALSKSTSSRRVYDCILCGEIETCSNNWPVTRRVERFEAKHNAECGAKILAKAEAGEAAA